MVLEALQIIPGIVQRDLSQDAASPTVQDSTLFLFYQIQVRISQATAKLVILRERKPQNSAAIIHFLNGPS